VLKQFYTAAGAVSAIDAELQSQRDATPWPGESQKDFAAGEALGREIAATVLALAANDQFGVSDPGAPPAGPGYWSSATAPIRGGYDAIPILLTPSELVSLIASPPPAFGSADYLSALAEVSSVSAGRTVEQLAIAQKWVPFSGVYFNEIAADLIVAHQRTETEAARIFALGNGAAFDAIIGCFNTKFTYWLIRPSKADLSITTPLGLPNHPSYPSAHNCESGAWEVVLADAFPSERGALATVVEEASISRLYAGLHYRFDNEAGLALGRAAGRLALSGKAPE
jgi:membrane-associated phospholipid phosphatase